MADFEIVKGDYGRVYRGIVESVDYSDCTGKIYVWDKTHTTKIIDGKVCNVSFADPNTHIDFVPANGDFDVEPGLYYGMFEFTKGGVLEHTLKFSWEVFDKEP